IDCSGLVQVAFQACGFDCPRDSDMLHAGFGRPLKQDRSLRLQRNDLVFWKGHVGIMLDNATLLHANGYHMQTVVEPLSVAIKRIADLYGTVTGVSRLKEFSTPTGQQAGEAAQ
ncbi:MAG: NlpC/P60 family protein, partial [Anderseniella sp.]|nr:NlpC/P60 family protein [Anderseniella sp.]